MSKKSSITTNGEKGNKMLTHIPVEPFPPGEYISEELELRGWTQDDLAEITGLSRRQIINLISGKSGITADTAVLLARAFTQEAKTWMELQMSYELAIAAKEDRDTARRAKIYEKIPVRDVRKRGWIPDVSSSAELESAVCHLLQISTIDESPSFAMAAKKSSDYGHDTPAQIAWFARAWQLASAAPASKYVESDLESAISELRKLATCPEDARKIPKLLADFGIRLLLIEHLPKSYIDGVAFFIDDGASPVIVLSLRYDRIDNLWHTLMHEIIHIKHRDDPRVDVDISMSTVDAERPDIEIRANLEASEYLFPKEKRESFIRRAGRVCSESDIVRTAGARGLHPGIVVGQLQGHGSLDYRYHRKLLAKIRSEIIGQALTDGWGHIPRI